MAVCVLGRPRRFATFSMAWTTLRSAASLFTYRVSETLSVLSRLVEPWTAHGLASLPRARGLQGGTRIFSSRQRRSISHSSSP